MEAMRPVKRPLQLPRQQMVTRTREVEWRQRFVCSRAITEMSSTETGITKLLICLALSLSQNLVLLLSI